MGYGRAGRHAGTPGAPRLSLMPSANSRQTPRAPVERLKTARNGEKLRAKLVQSELNRVFAYDAENIILFRAIRLYKIALGSPRIDRRERAAAGPCPGCREARRALRSARNCQRIARAEFPSRQISDIDVKLP
jgi:hypothetical protein